MGSDKYIFMLLVRRIAILLKVTKSLILMLQYHKIIESHTPFGMTLSVSPNTCKVGILIRVV